MRDKLRSSINAIKSLKRPTENWDDWLICFLSSKLDKTSRTEWENQVGNLVDRAFPTITQFQTFFNNRVRTLEILTSNEAIAKPSTGSIPKASKSAFFTAKSTQRRCSFCKGEHLIYSCFTFAALSGDDRASFVKSAKLCVNCLSPGHSLNLCRSKYNCSLCGRLHHKLLHVCFADSKLSENSRPAPRVEVEIKPSTSMPHTHQTRTYTSVFEKTAQNCLGNVAYLATARVALCGRDRRYLNVRALLDQASESTFISEDVVRALHLPIERVHVSVQGLSGSSSCVAEGITSFFMKPATCDYPVIPVRALVI